MTWLIEEILPTGLVIHCSESYWQKIVSLKHTSMKNHLDNVKLTLRSPDEIRTSKNIPDSLLIYRVFDNGFLCVVIKKRITEADGLVMTAYFTEKIKEGETIWKK